MKKCDLTMKKKGLNHEKWGLTMKSGSLNMKYMKFCNEHGDFSINERRGLT